jgi:TrmH family RNA methyltransferase
VKAFRALSTPKGRKERGLFQLEGVSLIAEAVAAGVAIATAYYCPERVRHQEERDLVAQLAECTEVFEVSERVLEQMTSTVTPQPIAAEAPIPRLSLEEVALAEQALVVAPAETQDPGNLGTMIRTAHAVGAAAVVALGQAVDPYSPKVVRATMGSLFAVPLVREPSGERFLSWCREQGVEVVAATVHAAESLFEARLAPRTALLLGSESQGLAPELSGPGVRGIGIPMPGGTESLNVAVAAGIMMYEYRRQWPQPLPPY